MHSVSAIIPAGGLGSRMNQEIPKQFIDVHGKPIIAYTAEALSKIKEIKEIIVAVPDGYIPYFDRIVKEFNLTKVKKIICGGASRTETVRKCLDEADDNEFILIHDSVRPFISQKSIKSVIDAAVKYGAASVGTMAVDTLKKADDMGFIKETVDRKNVWQIQTPQIFKSDLIKEAHKRAFDEKIEATDDCALLEMMGQRIKLIESDTINLKITYEKDLEFTEEYFNEFQSRNRI